MRTFIFDMDGTLADTMPTHQLAWDRLMPELGIMLDRDDFFGWSAGLTHREIFRVCWVETSWSKKSTGCPDTKNRSFASYIGRR